MRAIQRHRILQPDNNTYKEKTTSKAINNNPIIQTRNSENQIYNKYNNGYVFNIHDPIWFCVYLIGRRQQTKNNDYHHKIVI